MDPSQGRIGIDVHVTDAQGRGVTGLKRSDFRLLDEGQLLPLASFAASGADGPAPGDPPVSVILVLDEADIPRANFGEAELAAEAFLRSNSGRLTHPVTVYRVAADKLYASIKYSLDGNALADVVASGMGMRLVVTKPMAEIVRGPTNEIEIASESGASGAATSGTTSYKAALPTALRALGAITIEQRREPGRKLLFWIGPGWRIGMKSDKDLFDTITEFSTRLREARIELSIANRWLLGKESARYFLTDGQVIQYAAGVRLAQDSSFDNLALQVLALRSGGGTLTTNDELIALGSPDRNNISRLIAEHIADASNYYRLTFDPPRTNTVDEYHQLSVELARQGLTVHAVAGYYDEPIVYYQPTPATDQVTVAQLEQKLERKRGDRKLADELAGQQLTERISTPRLEAWLKRMPGSRSRQALTEVADASVFLSPPPDEVLLLPVPDVAARRAMLSRVANYLAREVPRLPNFYAERTTVQFGEPAPRLGQTWKKAEPDRKLTYERTTTEQIYFEDGKETTNRQKLKVKQATQQDLLQTTGTFGPILVAVLKAAASAGGMLTWSHWEKGAAGPVAVYHYVSSPNMPDYKVGFCCLAIDEVNIPFQRRVTFRGEIAVDPDTGHILRLTVKADLEPRLPLKNSSVMVEYGPVVMGGQTYFCPLRSVSLSRARRVWDIEEWGMRFKVYGPFRALLNDETFSRYHLFRAQTTILPGFVPVLQPQ